MKKGSLTLGVDIGGTKAKVALVDDKGRIVASYTYPTAPERGPERVVSELISSIKHRLGRSSSKAWAIGIGIAGQVEPERGVLVFAPNLGWENVPIKDMVREGLKIPVEVTNDVRAATFGEWLLGAGRGYQNMACLFVGTGIGGGMVLEGNLVRGCSNTAGEFGHMVIVADGRKCRCRRQGCLEAYAGGWAIAKRAMELIRDDPKRGEILLEIAGSLESITAASVAEAYRKGDRLAIEVIDEAIHHLASGIAGIVNAFNPCLVILGGGVVEGLPVMVARVEEEVRTMVLSATLSRLKFAKAALGSDAGVIGASMLPRKGWEGGDE